MLFDSGRLPPARRAASPTLHFTFHDLDDVTRSFCSSLTTTLTAFLTQHGIFARVLPSLRYPASLSPIVSCLCATCKLRSHLTSDRLCSDCRNPTVPRRRRIITLQALAIIIYTPVGHTHHRPHTQNCPWIRTDSHERPNPPLRSVPIHPTSPAGPAPLRSAVP